MQADEQATFAVRPGLDSLIKFLGHFAKTELRRQLGDDAADLWSITDEPVTKQIEFVQTIIAKRTALTTKRPAWVKALGRAHDVAIASDTLERSLQLFAEPRTGSAYQVGATRMYYLDVWYLHSHALCDKTISLFRAIYGEMLQQRIANWEERRKVTTELIGGIRASIGLHRDRLAHTEHPVVRAAEESHLLDAMMIMGHFDLFMKSHYESRVPVLEGIDLLEQTERLLALLDNEFFRTAKDLSEVVDAAMQRRLAETRAQAGSR